MNIEQLNTAATLLKHLKDTELELHLATNKNATYKLILEGPNVMGSQIINRQQICDAAKAAYFDLLQGEIKHIQDKLRELGVEL